MGSAQVSELGEPVRGAVVLFFRQGTGQGHGAIVRRAGLTPWPQLFHNLRASCETELTQEFALPVVIAWLGHSAGVALKHYGQVTDTDLRKVVRLPGAARIAL